VQSLQEEAAAAAVEKARMFAGKVKDSVEVQRKREERRRQKEMARVKGKEREESLVDGWMAGGEVKVGVNEPTRSLPQEERDNGARDTASAPTREVVHGQTSSSHPPLHSKLSDGPAYFTTVPATPVDHPWFSPATTSSIYHDLEAARSANIWTYPTTLLERARCASFRKIWEEGMYAGHGVRFGGEFLIYPGDPLRYHSHFVNTTLPSPETVIRPMELVAWGRLGTATKKAHLICCYDENGGRDDKDEKVAGRGTVDCYSLEWGNFG
jgi:tRNA-splicing endonuclease subunit Sen34